MSGSLVARLIKEAQLEHEKNLRKQKQILLMQAESKQLPEFLGLIGIGLLLECDLDAFVEFIKSQPVAIEIRDDQEGIARDEFKRYRQSVGLWPVKDCPLAHWWPETEKQSLQMSCDMANSERYSMLKLILGMAMDAYGYDPTSDKRQKATGENNGSIHAALLRHGIFVSNETIKKYMDEAKERKLYMPKDQ